MDGVRRFLFYTFIVYIPFAGTLEAVLGHSFLARLIIDIFYGLVLIANSRKCSKFILAI